MKNRRITKITFCLLLLTVSSVTAQDVLDILAKESPKVTLFAQATFKANRVVLGQSVETRKKGTLEFSLGTRYWNVPDNDRSQSFGADRFSANFNLGYAFTDRFTLGVGATSFDGVLNTFGKYRLVQQRLDGKVPFGITLAQNFSFFTRDNIGFNLAENSANRLAYSSQLLIARKFDQNFSLQLAPTFIHSQSNLPIPGRNNLFLLGFAGRYKLGNHVSIASEYNYLVGRDQGEQGFNVFALGVNWEVSDLILQFSMTNAKGFDDISSHLFTRNNFTFRPGGLHIGVNATYVLHTKERKLDKIKENTK